MHITPVSSGLRRLLAPALLLALPLLMTACGGGKATRPAPPPPTANWPKTVPDNPEAARSEEHTSELQSQSNLVCRLLLEKKKKNKPRTTRTHHKHNLITT